MSHDTCVNWDMDCKLMLVGTTRPLNINVNASGYVEMELNKSIGAPETISDPVLALNHGGETVETQMRSYRPGDLNSNPGVGFPDLVTVRKAAAYV